MPIINNLEKILILGSGPIEIGQAAEFDYAGTQACEALKEENIKVVLLNSNPATIMTDPQVADRVYIEPLTIDVLKRIIQLEQPNGILATTGGQTGLNLAMELERSGILKEYNIPILGTDMTAIKRAEDRNEFRNLMQRLDQPVPKSCTVEDIRKALEFVEEVGLPIVVRPAYTLGGTGGGMVNTMQELEHFIRSGLRQSPIHQVLLEQSIAGLIEIEYEVLRDSQGESIIVCGMENVDPVGIHTGDSIVVTPCCTLTKTQEKMLEHAALKIVNALNVVGSCNVQFALEPKSSRCYVIEVNPRVSRSSALASKATGYPIARIAAKLALGYTLSELDATKRPQMDYVVTKIPRWPFDKFPHADRLLKTQMKATGEVMAIGGSFAESLQKAIRSLETGYDSLFSLPLTHLSQQELEFRLAHPDDQELFVIAEYVRRGYDNSVDLVKLHELTKIQPFFLSEIKKIVDYYNYLNQLELLDEHSLLKAKQLGFSDAVIGSCFELTSHDVRNLRTQYNIYPDYCSIKTKSSPYFFSTYNLWNGPDDEKTNNYDKWHESNSVIVLGSGPIRIGQGIEFDYSTVHAAWAIRHRGYQAVIINNNPETVSTDSNISHRLYLEPLTEEDVLAVIEREKPLGVVVQFGGQTAINLAELLDRQSVAILGTSAANTAGMEDRYQFDQAMEKLGIRRPIGLIAKSKQEASELKDQLVYPVVVRPSFVLGGRGMEVIYSREELQDYLTEFGNQTGYPLLIDSYLSGIEIEVDAISDGTDVFLPGIMEHLERAGVHSGDSIAVFPAFSLDESMIHQVYEYTKKIACYFQVKGFLNIQFVISKGELYVLEVNPRSSRTVPFLSKVTGLSLAQIATDISLGLTLNQLGYLGLYQLKQDIVAVKVPVFSFSKLQGMEITLGPEMKSTGEVMGRDKNLEKALYKGFIAAKYRMPTKGKVLLTIADKDKREINELAHCLDQLGLDIYATCGTAKYLIENGFKCQVVAKLEQSDEILNLIRQAEIDMVVNTYTKGKQPGRDGFRIRSAAVENDIHCFTSLDTVRAYLRVVADQELWLKPL